MPKIVCAVTVDTEPDCSLNWERSFPLKFESVNIGIKKILQPLFIRFGVSPTYFISPEVLEDREAIKTIHSLKKCEIGSHLHSEYISPDIKYKNPAGTKSSQYPCFDIDNKTEFEKIKTLDKLIQNRLGIKPVSYRAARFGADLNTIHSLLKLGYQVDSSVTPHLNWRKQGGPNFEGYPEQPYFISQNDFSKPDKKNKSILEVPITIGKKRFPFLPNKWLFYRWLRPTHMSVLEQKLLIKDYFQKYKNKNIIVLTMMFHSMEIIPKASPYTRTKLEVHWFLRRLEKVLLYLKNLGCEFLTLKEIYQLYIKYHD